VAGYGLDGREVWVRFPADKRGPHSFRSALYNLYREVLSPGVKRRKREADHLPVSSDEVYEWVEIYVHFHIHLRSLVKRLKKVKLSL
jgi:hypothetical protein